MGVEAVAAAGGGAHVGAAAAEVMVATALVTVAVAVAASVRRRLSVGKSEEAKEEGARGGSERGGTRECGSPLLGDASAEPRTRGILGAGMVFALLVGVALVALAASARGREGRDTLCVPPSGLELIGAYGATASWESESGPSPPAERTSAGARALVAQGFALRFGFNSVEARRNFGAALDADGECSLCAVGAAYARTETINEGLTDELRAEAALLAQLAQRTAVDEREAAYAVLALAGFSAEGAAALRQARPSDATAAALHAEALMVQSKWRYYDDASKGMEGLSALGRAALSELDAALALDPTHPLALHYLIHLLEQQPTGGGQRALAAADALASANHSTHLTHMPGHAYLRAGEYEAAIEVNLRVIKDDSALADACLEAYGPGHQVASAMFGAMYAGNAALALEYATPAAETSAFGMVLHAFYPYPRVLVASRFGRWDVVDKEPLVDQPWAHPYAQAISRYAAAMSACSRCDLQRCRGHLSALGIARAAIPPNGENTGLEGTVDDGVFLRGSPCFAEEPNLAHIMALVGEAALAIAEARTDADSPDVGVCGALPASSARAWDAVVERLTEVVRIDDGFEYMEPERLYRSMRDCLGAAQLAAGDAEGAADTFRRDLERHARSPIALEGLRRALERGADGQVRGSSSWHDEASARSEPAPEMALCAELTL